MPARRFFVEGVRILGDAVEIGGSDARKIRTVLRLRAGDRIEVIDSSGAAYAARLAQVEGGVRAVLSEALTPAGAGERLRVDVAQAIPKGSKMDFAIEKSTELGANALLPFWCERTIASAGSPAKHERWQRLARAAAQQCGRSDVPDVRRPQAFDDLLAAFAQYDRVLFAWELAPRIPLAASLPEIVAGASRVLIVIGPEGGFTHDEAARARAAGAALLWLGHRILRTETAALALLAVIDALVS